MSPKVGGSYQVAPIALFTNIATRWCHLHWFQFRAGPPGGATCITFKFLPLGSDICIASLPMIVLLVSSVGIELLSSSPRVTSVKSHKHVSVSFLFVRETSVLNCDGFP